MRAKYGLGIIAMTLMWSSCKTAQKITTTDTTAKEEQALTTSEAPLLIEKVGGENKILYAKLDNRIKIYTATGSTKHLKVTAMGAEVQVIDDSKGIYRINSRRTGTSIDISATDTLTGKKIGKVFRLIELPPPTAELGVYKGAVKKNIKHTALSFRSQNAIVLAYATLLPIRCEASSFDVMQIKENGERKTMTNENFTGVFTDQVQEFTATAKAGDIWIFKSIKTSCTSEPIQDLVFILE